MARPHFAVGDKVTATWHPGVGVVVKVHAGWLDERYTYDVFFEKSGRTVNLDEHKLTPASKGSLW